MDLSNENIIHVNKDGTEYLQFKRLLEYKNIINCYTLRENNLDFRRNFEQEDEHILNESYKKICKALNIERQSIVRPYQKHTDCIKNVENSSQKFENVDGLITDKTGINLMLTFADCTPIFLYDPINKVIANVHSGWAGTVQKIGQKAALKMIKDYNTKPENIIACIGPCIQKCHFEVDEDVKQKFEQEFSYLNRNCDIIEKQKELVNGKIKYHIDTTLINRLILEEIGIKPENIINSKICTVCNSKQLHSYRADGEQSGRNVAILGMI